MLANSSPVAVSLTPLKIEAKEEAWPLHHPFRISRGSRNEAQVVVVTIGDGEHVGRGEGVPIKRYNQNVASVLAQIESIQNIDDLNRDKLQQLLPPGAARNALDCALWDLEAKRSGKRVWELANISIPPCSRRPLDDADASPNEATTSDAPGVDQVITSFTISLDTPEKMGEAAGAVAELPILKLKLGGDGSDLARVKAVWAAVPEARLLVDANESWSPWHYERILPGTV